MRTVTRGLSLAVAASLLVGEGLACGDKLLVIGRPVRSQRAHGAVDRASILVYLDAQGRLQATIEETSLGRDLALAGHTVRLASSADEIRDEVRSGAHDILLADIEDIVELETELLDDPGSPSLLPRDRQLHRRRVGQGRGPVQVHPRLTERRQALPGGDPGGVDASTRRGARGRVRGVFWSGRVTEEGESCGVERGYSDRS
jgi:hypothetical protein